MTDSNVAGVILPADVSMGDSLDARALALAPLFIATYLRRAPDRTDQEDLIARDSFVAGFRAGFRNGGREALQTCGELNTLLNDRRLQESLARLQQFIGATNEHGEAWKEIRKL